MPKTREGLTPPEKQRRRHQSRASAHPALSFLTARNDVESTAHTVPHDAHTAAHGELLTAEPVPHVEQLLTYTTMDDPSSSLSPTSTSPRTRPSGPRNRRPGYKAAAPLTLNNGVASLSDSEAAPAYSDRSSPAPAGSRPQSPAPYATVHTIAHMPSISQLSEEAFLSDRQQPPYDPPAQTNGVTVHSDKAIQTTAEVQTQPASTQQQLGIGTPSSTATTPTRPTTPAVKPVVKPPTLERPPALNFESAPVQWKGLTLDAAQWTFSSEQLQDIVSRAIRKSAAESYIRLLSPQTLDEELAKEMERLDTAKATTQAQYRFNMHRRTMLLQSLIALSTNSNDPAALTNLTTQLAEITSASDRLLESMLRIADQRAQIQHLQDVHDASALAMALRKLNGSYAKRTQELRDARGKVESLKMELEEAWRAAEEMAQEMDDLENFQTGFSGSEAEGAHVNGGDAGANGQGGELEDDEQYAENDDSVNLAQVMNITGKAVSTKATTVTNPPPIPPHPPSAFSHERSKSTGTIMNGSVSGGDGASIRRRGTTTSSIRNGIESDRMSRVSAARKRSSRTSKASLRLPKSFNTPSPPSATTPNANGDTASITSRRSVRSSKSGKSVRSRGKPQRKGTINSDTGVSPSPGGANVNVNGQASTSQVPPVPNLGATPSAHPKEDSFLEMSETRPASPTTPTGSGVGENLPPLPTAKTASTTNGDANADTQSEVVPAPDASSSSSSSHRQLHSHSHSLSLTRSLSNPNSLSAEPRRPETLSFDIPPIDISFSDPPSNLSLTLSNPDLDGTRSRSSLDSLMNHHHSSTSSTQLQSTSTNSSTGRRVMSMQQPPSFLSRVRRGRGSGGGSGSGSELMGMSMSVDDTAIGSSSKGKKGKSKTRSKVFDGWPWSLSLGSSSSSHKDKDKEKDKEKDKKGKTRTSSESAGSSLGASVSTRKSTSGDGMGIGGSGSWRRTMTMPFMRASLDDSLRSSSSRGRIDEAVVEDEDEEAEVGESVGEGESANVAGEREEVHVGDLEVHGDVRADGSEKLEVVGGDDGAENQKGVEEVGQPEDEQGDDGEEEGEEGEGEGVEDEDPTVVLGSTFKTVDGEERGKDLPEGKQVDDELLPEGGHDHDTAEVTSTTVNPALESDTKPE